MLGESFILMLNYREEAICSPDMTSFSPSADCVHETHTLAQVKGEFWNITKKHSPNLNIEHIQNIVIQCFLVTFLNRHIIS